MKDNDDSAGQGRSEEKARTSEEETQAKVDRDEVLTQYCVGMINLMGPEYSRRMFGS